MSSASVFEELIFSTAISCVPNVGMGSTGDPAGGVVLPGSDECRLVHIQSRQSLEAQQQQERWVSDVAHEFKTPLTALMLVSDRPELAVNEDDTAWCNG